MKRKIDAKLTAWKDNPARQPLLVLGARQVGKTYAVQRFAKNNFDDCAYFNFEEQNTLQEIFKTGLEPQRLLNALSAYRGLPINPNSTLVIFDEVQACPAALTSLKYFSEKMPNLQIIATGSLIGVASRHQGLSFPVGKVEFAHLQPLDFEEFLWACGQELLADLIRNHFNEPRAFALHEKALEYLDTYLLLGGMPAVVATYSSADDKQTALQNALPVRLQILNSYQSDMSKYVSPTQSRRILASYLSLPAQLAKDNAKFQYKLVAKGAKSSLFGDALDWLEQANIVLKVQRVDEPLLPLAGNKDLSAFKLYANDCGLLAELLGITSQELLPMMPDTNRRGAVIENYVASALAQTRLLYDSELYYWKDDSKSGGKAEIDFLIERNGEVIPLEVKSGRRTKSLSLKTYMQRYKPSYGIRLSRNNFAQGSDLLSLPLYAAFCLMD